MMYTAEKAEKTVSRPSLRPIGQPTLESELRVALEHARRLTAMYGTDQPEVAVAWDVVEELLVARARQRANAPSGFENYCERHPDALECRLYEV